MIAYSAGPLPFTEGGRYYQRWRLKPALLKAGYTMTTTWGAREVKSAALISSEDEGSRRIIWRCLLDGEWTAGMKAMDEADLVVAVTDGAPDDSRLATEVEYAISKGKRIIGLSTDLRRSHANPAWRRSYAEQLIATAGGAVASSLAELVAIIAPSSAPPSEGSAAAPGDSSESL